MTAASSGYCIRNTTRKRAKEGGPFQMVQLLVNLPARDKMSPPKYQAIQNNTIPKVTLDDAGSTVEVIAGTYQNTRGAASTFTPVNLLNARLKKGSAAGIFFPGS